MGASHRCRRNSTRRLPLSGAMNRAISKLANEKKRASVVTASQGFTQCGWMFLAVPPPPACQPNFTMVGTRNIPKIRRPHSNAPAYRVADATPSDQRESKANAAYGSSSGHDMWTCSTHGIAAPIITNATAGETIPRLKTGTASKKPTKNTSAGASTYEGLMTCVENSSVHGNVINQPHTSHFGSEGRRRVRYHANPASAAIEMMLRNTNDDSGTPTIFMGRPTRSDWSAPGISLFVQTTSGPKYGQAPVAWYRRPIRKICVSSSKKNSLERPNSNRKRNNAERATTQIVMRRAALVDVTEPPKGEYLRTVDATMLEKRRGRVTSRDVVSRQPSLPRPEEAPPHARPPRAAGRPAVRGTGPVRRQRTARKAGAAA